VFSLLEQKPARNVYDALNWCNPKTSIEPWLLNFYVDREQESPIEEIKEHLLSELEHPKLLLTGPRGSGKNTEMVKLAQDKELKRRFYIRVFPGAGNIHGLIAKILQNVVDQAKDLKMADLDVVKEAGDFLLFRSSWNKSVEISAVPEKDVFNEKWVNNKRHEEKRAKVIKKDPSEVGTATMSGWIKKITEEILKKKRKNVLLFITGLDKLNKDQAVELFKNKANDLNGVKCFIVFTFPIELYFDPSITMIVRSYSDIYFFKNINRWRYNEPKLWNYDRLNDILTRRVSITLFEPQVKTIDLMIHFSGGVPYELLDLLRHCALLSSRRLIHWIWYYKPFWYIWLLFKSHKHQKIRSDVFISSIITRRQNIFRRTLTKDQFSLLESIYTKKIKFDIHNPDHKELYDNNLVFVYGSERDIYFGINPILETIIVQRTLTDEEFDLLRSIYNDTNNSVISSAAFKKLYDKNLIIDHRYNGEKKYIINPILEPLFVLVT